MTVALIAAIPGRAGNLQELIDRLGSQTRTVDAVLICFDGDWGDRVPELKAPFEIVPHIHGGWHGHGARYSHPELARLSRAEPLLIIDDDVCPDLDYVERSLDAQQRLGGFVSWYGATYGGTFVRFGASPPDDTRVAYFSVGTLLADAGSVIEWANDPASRPFFDRGGYNQIYLSMWAWQNELPVWRPRGRDPLSWFGDDSDGSWRRWGARWRGMRRAVAEATGFAPNLDAVHSGLPRDPREERVGYESALHALANKRRL